MALYYRSDYSVTFIRYIHLMTAFLKIQHIQELNLPLLFLQILE